MKLSDYRFHSLLQIPNPEGGWTIFTRGTTEADKGTPNNGRALAPFFDLAESSLRLHHHRLAESCQRVLYVPPTIAMNEMLRNVSFEADTSYTDLTRTLGINPKSVA